MSDVRAALAAQALSCRVLGSGQYASLLDQMVADHRRGGPMSALLDGRTDSPSHDALPLRLLGFLHHAALTGRAPELAARFASCGGDGGAVAVDAVLAVLDRLAPDIDDALARPVQTNEVGRSVCHLAIANWLPSIGVDEFDLWEVGASAGLNLSFDSYAAETAEGVMGQVGSALTLPKTVFARAPRVVEPARCIDRRGCDSHPIDLEHDSIRLESFVWPDQLERRARLRAAIDITRPLRHRIDKASADEWIVDNLAHQPLRPTVIFHSIVWQYLGPDVKKRFREAVIESGEKGRPIIWARMEPAGDHADLRVDGWRDGTRFRRHLADVGYHGADFAWLDVEISD